MAKNDNGIDLASNGDYWQAVWYDNNGKRQRKSLGHKKKVTKRQARQEMIALAEKMAIDPRQRERQEKVRLVEHFNRYRQVKGLELKPGTMANHESTMTYMTEFFSADTTLQSIQKSQATDWVAWLASKPGKKKDSGMAKATIRKHVRSAKTIIGLAITEEILTRNPFQHLEGTTPKVKKNWADLSTENIEALLNNASSQGWRALIALCAYAGLRRGEALRLEWSDVKWAENKLIVRNFHDEDTTKDSEREVLLIPELAAILLDSREQAVGAQVVEVSPHSLHQRMMYIIKRAELAVYSIPHAQKMESYHLVARASRIYRRRLAWPWPGSGERALQKSASELLYAKR